MTAFIIANALGIAAGVVLKTLVPMPFIDQPVRNAWAWAWRNTVGRLG